MFLHKMIMLKNYLSKFVQHTDANEHVRISYYERKAGAKEKPFKPENEYIHRCMLAYGGIGLFFEKADYTNNAFIRFWLDWLNDESVEKSTFPKK